mmetsp:Transcript_19886/g.60049  ORF Transcript_19886/g.60049 Transcript_19886/m.60049 type:complete len:217 (+) Transcript_19886:162-812(+)
MLVVAANRPFTASGYVRSGSVIERRCLRGSFLVRSVPVVGTGAPLKHRRSALCSEQPLQSRFGSVMDVSGVDEISRATSVAASGSAEQHGEPTTYTPPVLEQVLFVEAGSGADQHGQNATKAAVRACRNAIEFNSLPAIRQLVPNGYDGLKLLVKIGVPDPETVDENAVKAVFPYGKVFLQVVDGGLRASSGVAIPALGDVGDDWFIAVAAVTVGY